MVALPFFAGYNTNDGGRVIGDMITDFHVDESLKRHYYERGYWQDATICDVWHRRVAAYATKEYVRDDLRAYTYSDVDEKAGKLAAWLMDQGIENGDVVTFQLPIWAEFCIVYTAILKVGGVCHPLPRNFNEEDLLRAMKLVDSSAFICPTFACKVDYEQQILNIREDIPTLKAIALIDRVNPAKSDLPVWSDIERTYEPLREHESGAKPDDVVCVLSTSGTTGTPKAVMFTHNNILFSERSMVSAFGLTEDDVAYMPSPLNHATGFFHGLITPMISGGRVVLTEHFCARGAIDLANEQGVTWTMGATPFIYDTLSALECTGASLDTLRLFLCGGAPVPPALIEHAHEHGIILCEIYGSTESCPHIYVPREHCLEWNGAWSGIPFEGVEVRVADDQGNDVPCGEQGEELSRGPHLFVGYLHNEGANHRAMTDDGWFRSGDLCFMDEHGRVRINGRKKEIIIRGGENISANEIDADIMDCPGVGDHATIGMPDERLGERICTFVVPACGAEPPTKESIIAYLESKHVQKRLWPERVEVIDAIPRTATGKVKRFMLAEELKRRMDERKN